MSLLALAMFIAGCTPSGPRALLKGKKLMERGDYTAAMTEFKTATSLLATNAQAWNYLGVACQYAGQPTDAVTAYQRALVLDRDLMEAHYNLGCLWLEQNKADAAEGEFTAYTLRRSKSPEGWLKLGLAQLQAHDIAMAERSFSTVLYLSPNNAEALNGLGLACVERGHPHERDAARFFVAATRQKPDFGPAWLNLATVAQLYLHDDTLALKNYRAYLALTPRPANWDAVNDLANSLESSASVAAAASSSSSLDQSQTGEPVIESRIPSGGNTVHAASPARSLAAVHTNSNLTHGTSATQIVKVQPQPAIVGIPVAEEPSDSTTGKPGVIHKLNPLNWFHSTTPENYNENGVTPLPPAAPNENRSGSTPTVTVISSPPVQRTIAPAPVMVAKPIKIVQPAPPTFPRYLYLSPRKPNPGDRRTAANSFTRAREFEQKANWVDALQAYQQATELDPDWFEAQYNYGVMAYRLRDYSQSLGAYEMALAIQPDSVDARYNFALALKAAGYVTDAVNELKKILAVNPDEIRAHLALGNLYAQQLRDPARARQHYLKVLTLNPGHPQAPDIQFWLSSNPP